MHAAFFWKIVCLRKKFILRLQKRKKKIVVAIKKCYSNNFHIWKLFDEQFLQKFFLIHLIQNTEFYAKTRFFFKKFDDTILAKSMKI